MTRFSLRGENHGVPHSLTVSILFLYQRPDEPFRGLKFRYPAVLNQVADNRRDHHDDSVQKMVSVAPEVSLEQRQLIFGIATYVNALSRILRSRKAGGLS